jgi:hypothetical protein
MKIIFRTEDEMLDIYIRKVRHMNPEKMTKGEVEFMRGQMLEPLGEKQVPTWILAARHVLVWPPMGILHLWVSLLKSPFIGTFIDFHTVWPKPIVLYNKGW